ncbi:MAG: PAS domain S-box protein [Cyanobacteriota bacterium]
MKCFQCNYNNTLNAKYCCECGVVLVPQDSNNNIDEFTQAKKQFYSFLESSLEPVIATNDFAEIVYWNKGAEKFFGYTFDEVHRKNMADFIIPDQFKDKFENAFELLRNNIKGQVFDRVIERPLKNKLGEEKICEISVSTINIQGLTFALGSIRDITKRKILEHELIQERNKLEEVVKQKTADLNKSLKEFEEVNILLTAQNEELQSKEEELLAQNEELEDTRKKIQKAYDLLEVSEKRCRTIFSFMNVGLTINEIIFDNNNKPVDSKFININSAFEKITGIVRNKIVGKTFKQLFTNKKTIFYKAFEKATLEGNIEPYEIIISASNKYFQLSSFMVEKDKFAFMINDLTESKEAERNIFDLQAQQKTILDNIPDIAWIKDINSNYITINEAFAKACGISIDKVIDKTDFDFFPEYLAKLYTTDDKEVIKTGKRKIVDEPFVGKAGKEIIIETIKTPFYNHKGEIIGTAGIARDITIRKKAEEAIREANLKFEAISENATDAIVMLDTDGKIVYWNPEAERMYKATEEEVLGQLYHEFFVPPQYHENYLNELKAFKESGSGPFLGKNKEFNQQRKDGTYFSIDISVYPLKLKGKWFVVGIARDITERKLSEKTRKTFIATLSHDLRVPLIAENKALKYLLKGSYGKITKKQRIAVNNMLNSNIDLLNLVNNLLDVYKYESEKLELFKESINLTKLLNDSISEILPLLEEGQKQIVTNVEDTIFLNADKYQIKRVLINLLSNAINHSSDDSVININVNIKKEYVIVSIIDQGTGIPESDIDKIFDRYYTSSKKFKKIGTGLGLFLSKQIIQAHGGKIWVESKVDSGSTFSFSLPI